MGKENFIEHFKRACSKPMTYGIYMWWTGRLDSAYDFDVLDTNEHVELEELLLSVRISDSCASRS